MFYKDYDAKMPPKLGLAQVYFSLVLVHFAQIPF